MANLSGIDYYKKIGQQEADKANKRRIRAVQERPTRDAQSMQKDDTVDEEVNEPANDTDNEVDEGENKNAKIKATKKAQYAAKLNKIPMPDVGSPSEDRFKTGFNEAQQGVSEAERFGLVKHLSRSRLAALKRNLLRQYQAGKYGNVDSQSFADKVESTDLNTKKPVKLKQTSIKPIDPRIDELKRQMALKRTK